MRRRPIAALKHRTNVQMHLVVVLVQLLIVLLAQGRIGRAAHARRPLLLRVRPVQL